jgi:hypothetical protein
MVNPDLLSLLEKLFFETENRLLNQKILSLNHLVIELETDSKSAAKPLVAKT